MSTFSVSRSLIKYPINEKYIFVYHQLHGNSRILLNDVEKKLKEIEKVTKNEGISIIGEDTFNEFEKLRFIIKDNVNERTFIKEELDNRKDNLNTGVYFERLHLSTTNQCNMECKYCFCNTFDFNKDINSREPIRFPNQKMSFQTAKKAIDNSIDVITSNNKNYLSIEFFGGEPLLNPDLIIDVLDYYGNGEKFGLNIEYGCTTNGTHLQENLLPYLKKYNVQISISIDYIDYKSGNFRGDLNSKVKWSALDKNIKTLLDNDISVKFQSVLSDETWDKYSYDLIDYASLNGIKSVGLILAFDFEFFRKYDPLVIGKRVLDIYDYCKSKNVQLTGYWYLSYLGIINPDYWNERKSWKTCPTIGRLLSIEPDGHVYACKTTSKLLGHIDSFKNIFKDNNYAYYAMRAFSNSKSCEGCEIEGFCSGSCTGAVENKFKDIYNCDEYYCKTVKYIINGLLKRYVADLANEETLL